MKKAFWWWVNVAAHVVLLYWAFGEGSAGAMRVLQFSVWIGAVLGTVAMSDQLIDSRAAEPPKRWISSDLAWLYEFVALSLFVWHGHWITAIGQTWLMFAYAYHGEQVKERRKIKAAQKEPAPPVCEAAPPVAR